MNISYNWLKRYIDITESPEEIAKILTSIGLEVGTLESASPELSEGLKIGEVVEESGKDCLYNGLHADANGNVKSY